MMPGRHLGAAPADSDTLATMQQLHARGFLTIDDTAYRALLAAGVDRFRQIPAGVPIDAWIAALDVL
jgi:hypothetical protein